eukprot:6188751-Pleurochrysis_carterae.AAC.3
MFYKILGTRKYDLKFVATAIPLPAMIQNFNINAPKYSQITTMLNELSHASIRNLEFFWSAVKQRIRNVQRCARDFADTLADVEEDPAHNSCFIVNDKKHCNQQNGESAEWLWTR